MIALYFESKDNSLTPRSSRSSVALIATFEWVGQLRDSSSPS